jgi:hypothetical protein
MHKEATLSSTTALAATNLGLTRTVDEGGRAKVEEEMSALSALRRTLRRINHGRFENAPAE